MSIWFFLDAFDIPTSARNVMLVLAVQSLSTLLPFTPGGLGTQQGFLLYAFRDSNISTPSSSPSASACSSQPMPSTLLSG